MSISFPTRLVRLTGLALLAVTSTVASAAQINVPADYSSLQDAIDAAAPCDVIVIDGGEHPPIKIDKCLWLVGTNSPLLRPTTIQEDQNEPFGPTFHSRPVIRLDGAGVGDVSIAGIRIEGTVSQAWFNNLPSCIEGDGFDNLYIVDCELTAPAGFESTGAWEANHGVDVDVGDVVVMDSTITGGSPGSDEPWFMSSIFPGGDGIRATGDVTICDSTVRGGDGMINTVFDGMGFDDCNDFSAGEGGAGVRTPGTVCTCGGSTITGGAGGQLTLPPPFGTLCIRLDGPDYDVGFTCGFNQLMLAPQGGLGGGQTLTLTWDSPDAATLLVWGWQPIGPIQVGNEGLLYMDPNAIRLLPLPAPGLNSGTLSLDDPTLAGLPIVFQMYNPSVGLSRPVIEIIQP